MDEMEEFLTLDELFLLYEATVDRQKRLLQTIGAAFGASPVDDEEAEMVPISQVNLQGDEKVHYEGGEIAAGSNVLFGYRQRPSEG